jgi:hypothetical protein
MVLDENTVEKISKRVMELVTEQIKNEFGVQVRYAGGKYSPTVFNVKIEFTVPANKMVAPLEKLDSREIGLGFARPGTPCMFGSKPVTIVKARRAKYIFVFDSDPSSQKIAPFDFFSARP